MTKEDFNVYWFIDCLQQALDAKDLDKMQLIINNGEKFLKRKDKPKNVFGGDSEVPSPVSQELIEVLNAHNLCILHERSNEQN